MTQRTGRLIGTGQEVRSSPASAGVPEPGLSRQRASPTGGPRGGRSVPSLVLQRPSRDRVPITRFDGGVRSRPPRRAPFVGAREDDAVVFTRNTTDAINLMSRVLPAEARVFVFETEHHANLLPWRLHRTTYLAAPTGPQEALETLRSGLADASIGVGRSRSGDGDRRVERDRRGLADRGDGGSGAPVREPGCSSTRRSSRPTRPSTWRPPASTTSRCPATSSTRHTARGLWSGVPIGSARGPLPDGRRRGSVRHDRRGAVGGAAGPAGGRVAERGRRRRVRYRLRDALDIGMDAIAAHERALRAPSARALVGRPGTPAVHLVGRRAAAHRRAHVQPRRGTTTASWPRSCPPSTASAFGTGASAPIR